MGRFIASRPVIAVLLIACLLFQGCGTSFENLETDSEQGSGGMAVATASSLQPDQVVRITTIDDKFEATFFALDGDKLIVRDKVYPFGGKYTPDRERFVYDLAEVQRIEVATGRNATSGLIVASVLVAFVVYVGLSWRPFGD